MSLWYLFFFSSRRRHTRLQGDWSSDVCSSDLHGPLTPRPSSAAGRGSARAALKMMAGRVGPLVLDRRRGAGRDRLRVLADLLQHHLDPLVELRVVPLDDEV